MIKTLNLNVSATKKDVAPKQRPDICPSIGDHIQVSPTFENTWANLRPWTYNRGGLTTLLSTFIFLIYLFIRLNVSVYMFYKRSKIRA